MYYRRFAVMTGFDRTVKSSTNTRDEGKLVVLDSSEVGGSGGMVPCICVWAGGAGRQ